jgi:hypothetical protein
MDGAGGEPSVRRIGGRATQEQLSSISDAAILNYLIYSKKIAALRNDSCFPFIQRFLKYLTSTFTKKHDFYRL